MEAVYTQLLGQVKAINKKYDNILSITGEGYNIFRILKMQSAENKLHSAFLANLLDPKGSHGQKDVFLKLFIDLIIPKDFLFDTPLAKVVVEKHVGFKNVDKTEGGRIDICITDQKNREILIENKIYAIDQENQLLRYSNYNKKAYLIYLCLNSESVSEASCKGLILNEDYHIVTYKSQIIKWLTYCKKEAVSHPILRETITQYINLIKHLTGQTINKEMKNELVAHIISSRETLSASFEIANNIDAARGALLKDLKKIVIEIGAELNLETSFYIDLSKKFSGINFYKSEWETGKISFQFQHYHRNLMYGISRKEENKNIEDQYTVDIYNKLGSLGGKSTTWWPFCKDVEETYFDWKNSKEPWLAIIDGSIKNYLKTKITEMVDLLEDHKL